MKFSPTTEPKVRSYYPNNYYPNKKLSRWQKKSSHINFQVKLGSESDGGGQRVSCNNLSGASRKLRTRSTPEGGIADALINDLAGRCSGLRPSAKTQKTKDHLGFPVVLRD
jgi:hypothetical protein